MTRVRESSQDGVRVDRSKIGKGVLADGRVGTIATWYLK
jgi:hypothetical protein